MNLLVKLLIESKYNFNLDIDNVNMDNKLLSKSKHDIVSLLKMYEDSLFVDLDLPSGTFWAKYNLGVNPTELTKKENWCGDYYAWGEIETKSNYSWGNYKYVNTKESLPINSLSDNFIKYCLNKDSGYNGFIDNLQNLELSDDVAYIKSNGKMRIPTIDEVNELINYTTYEFVTYNDIDNLHGLLLTSIHNGNLLFIPAGGWYLEEILEDFNECGYIWCNSVHDEFDCELADSLCFFGSNSIYDPGIYNDDGSPRAVGQNIRPVLNKSKYEKV